ncbi:MULTISPECIES: DUF5753 domain-containing protein [Actinomadura]|uniref:DUF5753 domain-containing protein n=1 Tax=Actinomadura yumaensis TaxID=111807 RepID=A0ABW2CTT4_9ACTN|nr:DUF5753 domain-containing protein [Actinomadura sp. J1-007]MWK40496.1 XRE family transcriptional regulator [Actinomadura sp. J1-007]
MNSGKATVSRIENGEARLDGTRAALVDKGWNTGGLFGFLVWYASLGHDPEWFGRYVTFEQRARLIRIFEPLTVPGLFQQEDYARALLASGGAADPEAVFRERMERQAILERAFITAVVSEAALRWPVGTPEIMRSQLQHLLELAERPNVVILVVPMSFDTGAYAGLNGPMMLLSGDGFGELAYADSPLGGRLVSSPSDVGEFAVMYARISAKALPQGLSKNLIETVLEAFSDDVA